MTVRALPGFENNITSDVITLLNDVESHIVQYLRRPVDGDIMVYSDPDAPHPLTRYTPGAVVGDPFTVRLTAQGRYWSQYAYQFAHELCHVLTGHEQISRFDNNPNQWFIESLCELASLFTLRRMAELWQTRPPFSNRQDYARALHKYFKELVNRPARQLPPGLTVAEWLRDKENLLRKDAYSREDNAVVSLSLLNLFEAHPQGWNAVRYLPKSDSAFVDYLAEWYESVPEDDKPFIESLMAVFDLGQ